MASQRVLVTGLSTFWGGRLARALERDPGIEAIVGVDGEEPAVELERTEYVKVGAQQAPLRRVVEAAGIDTVVDTRLVDDPTSTARSSAHETNVLGTMNVLAACAGADSPVRKVVFKSSAHFYGCEQDDPAFFDETMGRPHPPRTAIERDVLEAEAAVAEFAERRRDVAVTILRFVDVLGPDVSSPLTRLLSLPAVPMILGFDPRLALVHEDDVVGALEHVVRRTAPGVFNVAADGVLSLSEVAGLLSKPYAPLLPPWGTGLAAAALGRVGLGLPPELLRLLRYGRGVDNRRLKASGFELRYTSRETVLRLGEHLRLRPFLRAAREPYRYEHEVEEFLRRSPHVRDARRLTGVPLSPAELRSVRRLLAAEAERGGLPPAGGPAPGAAARDEADDEAALRAAAGATPEPELGLEEDERGRR